MFQPHHHTPLLSPSHHHHLAPHPTSHYLTTPPHHLTIPPPLSSHHTQPLHTTPHFTDSAPSISTPHLETRQECRSDSDEEVMEVHQCGQHQVRDRGWRGGGAVQTLISSHQGGSTEVSEGAVDQDDCYWSTQKH